MGAVSYADFILSKTKAHAPRGLETTAGDMHDALFPFQKAVTSWGLNKGRACLFAGTGLGKTRMQCEFSRQLDGKRLIVAPLAVADQTIHEARELSGMRVKRVHTSADVAGDGVYIVNYDRLHHVEGINFTSVVLDESSILKSHDGAYRTYIQERFRDTPFKLPCTATPSPNDYMELGTHAEFVGAMSRMEMMATFFMHDGGDTSKWRLKRHARADFWKWVSTWAVVFSHPKELGYDMPGYDLPELIVRDRIIEVESDVAGGLFGDSKVSATQLHKVLRDSAEDRVQAVAEIVASEPDEPWLIWVNTDNEQDLVRKTLPGIASVQGSDKDSDKEDRLLGFARGIYPRLVTKPKIAGFGMNWQRCARMIFCGVTYSYEQMYQAIRRCWRFGQTRDVIVYVVTCNAQDSIKSALRAKDEAFKSMAQEMGRYCLQEVAR